MGKVERRLGGSPGRLAPPNTARLFSSGRNPRPGTWAVTSRTRGIVTARSARSGQGNGTASVAQMLSFPVGVLAVTPVTASPSRRSPMASASIIRQKSGIAAATSLSIFRKSRCCLNASRLLPGAIARNSRALLPRRSPPCPAARASCVESCRADREAPADRAGRASSRPDHSPRCNTESGRFRRLSVPH